MVASADNSISCKEYQTYQELPDEYRSVKWLRYILGVTAVDAFLGDEEERLKELCRIHYNFCPHCQIWERDRGGFTGPGIK